MPRPIIVFHSHTHHVLGGAEMSLLAIMEDCKRQGYDVHVIVPAEGDFKERAKKQGFCVYVVPTTWWTINGHHENHPGINARALAEMNSILQRVQPALCVTNTLVRPWLAYAARMQRVRHAWIIREFGDTDHNLTFWMPKKDIARAISELSDKVFTSSNALREHFAQLMNRDDIDVVAPSVEKPVTTGKSSPFRAGVLKLVCVGNISDGKGQMDAIRAAERLKKAGAPVQLILVGRAAEQAYMDRAQKYVRNHKLSNQVSFAGYQTTPADFVAHADIALVCSRTEAFGRVTVEALLLGVPVIGTNTAGTKDILHKYSEDLLYTFGDDEQLAGKIMTLWSNKKRLSKIQASLEKTTANTYNKDAAHTAFFSYAAAALSDKLADVSPTLVPLNELLRYQRSLEKSQSVLVRVLRAIRHRLAGPTRKAKKLARKIVPAR